MSITNIEFADGLVIFINDNDKPLTTEPPLDPPVTEYDRIEARRFELYKMGMKNVSDLHKILLEEEQLNDALLEQEHEWMQSIDDEEHYEY